MATLGGCLKHTTLHILKRFTETPLFWLPASSSTQPGPNAVTKPTCPNAGSSPRLSTAMHPITGLSFGTCVPNFSYLREDFVRSDLMPTCSRHQLTKDAH